MLPEAYLCGQGMYCMCVCRCMFDYVCMHVCMHVCISDIDEDGFLRRTFAVRVFICMYTPTPTQDIHVLRAFVRHMSIYKILRLRTRRLPRTYNRTFYVHV